MASDFFTELQEARMSGQPFVAVTVVQTQGSVPRHPGAKMMVFPDGSIRGTVGGGKFESLVIAEAKERLKDGQNLLKKYPLREGEMESFGAICGGEVTLSVTVRNRSQNSPPTVASTSRWWMTGRSGRRVVPGCTGRWWSRPRRR